MGFFEDVSEQDFEGDEIISVEPLAKKRKDSGKKSEPEQNTPYPSEEPSYEEELSEEDYEKLREQENEDYSLYGDDEDYDYNEDDYDYNDEEYNEEYYKDEDYEENASSYDVGKEAEEWMETPKISQEPNISNFFDMRNSTKEAHEKMERDTKEASRQQAKDITKGEETVERTISGLFIDGNVSSESDLTLDCEVHGNLVAKQKATIMGIIDGNVSCKELLAKDARIIGDISCASVARIEKGSVVIGNIDADTVVLAGAVKGNIKAKKSITLIGQAVVQGDLTSAKIHLSDEAIIEGVCHWKQANGNLDQFFQ